MKIISFLYVMNHLSNKIIRCGIINKFPKAQIIGISPHKLGPVYAASKFLTY